jgi:hypothetical protein
VHPNFKPLFNPAMGGGMLSVDTQAGSSSDGAATSSGQFEWNVGIASRQDAEEMVLGKPNVKTGHFVVRISASGNQGASASGPPYVLTTLLSTVTMMFQHDKMDINPATGFYEINGMGLTADCRSLKEVIHHLSRTREHSIVPVLLQGSGMGRSEPRSKSSGAAASGAAASGASSGGGGDNLMATLLANGIDRATAQVMVNAKAETDQSQKDAELMKTLVGQGMSESAARAMIGAKTAAETAKAKEAALLQKLLSTGIDEATARKMVEAANVQEAAKAADEDEEPQKLDARTLSRQKALMAKKIRLWLEEQVISASMDEKAAPVRRLLKWVKKSTAEGVDDQTRDSKLARVSVCFCGPPGLGAMLADTVDDLGPDFEFASHMQ